ncbi:peptidoglycan-binding protein [Streptomyces sp. NPDC020983]|uniref:peptidoglycan-binding protein n=1 Tax=Streptomyces sp. NPDC020983 TaxID=3365106 RepID=UPI00379A973E
MLSTSFRRRVLARVAVPLTAAALATGIAAATATPAVASGSYNGNAYISGSGSPDDDLNDEGALNLTTNTVSNATCFWQNILYVDGQLKATDIDGSFGPDTQGATRTWQFLHGLTQDGSAGKATFTKAGTNVNLLSLVGSDVYNGSYTGVNRNLPISRAANGVWSFYNLRDEKWYTTSYNTRTCPHPV